MAPLLCLAWTHSSKLLASVSVRKINTLYFIKIPPILCVQYWGYISIIYQPFVAAKGKSGLFPILCKFRQAFSQQKSGKSFYL